MENANWDVIVLFCIAALVVGGAAGVFIGRLTARDRKKISELEGELADSRSEQEAYRQQVNAHFQKTSELFGRMTDSYRAVFMHLAEGSQQLCTNDAAKLKSNGDAFPALEHEEEEEGGQGEPSAAESPSPESSSPDQPEDRTAPGVEPKPGAGGEEQEASRSRVGEQSESGQDAEPEETAAEEEPKPDAAGDDSREAVRSRMQEQQDSGQSAGPEETPQPEDMDRSRQKA